MKRIGVLLLVVGILLIIVANISYKSAQGTEISVGYMQNGSFEIIDQYNIGKSYSGIDGAHIFNILGIISVILGVGVFIYAIIHESNSQDNNY